jgi:hypothetical protein
MNHSDRFAIVFCYASIATLILLPFVMIYVIHSNSHKLDDPDFQNKYGFLIENLAKENKG